MRTYLPLKSALQEDDFVVGVKATILSHLEKDFNVPFSLVITSDVFFEFVSYNALGERIRPFLEGTLRKEEQVSAFAELASVFEHADFPQSVLQQLRECYELVCLDTDNLNDLTKSERHILTLRRSTSYEDADGICRGRLITKNNFESFLKRLKSVYLSAFCPSSIDYRQKKEIKEFSMAVVLTRLPLVTTCLESDFDEEANTITIKSYTGFLDYTNTVQRDVFTTSIDFLKITSRSVVKQKKVVVFDMESNMAMPKHYMTMSSAQSAPDPLLLEVARLTKKVSHFLDKDSFHMEFVADKHKNLYCIDVLEPEYVQEQQTTLEEVASDSQKSEESGTLQSNSLDLFSEEDFLEFESQEQNSLAKDLSLPSTDQLVHSYDELGQPLQTGVGTQETGMLIQGLITFLAQQKNNDSFGNECQTIIRSLEFNPNSSTLARGLLLAKHIIQSWDT
ncbi:MAG: PEP/pyruvate-binding domain-containing protein [Candidatus Woesearchaeota archaeon]